MLIINKFDGYPWFICVSWEQPAALEATGKHLAMLFHSF